MHPQPHDKRHPFSHTTPVVIAALITFHCSQQPEIFIMEPIISQIQNRHLPNRLQELKFYLALLLLCFICNIKSDKQNILQGRVISLREPVH